jgi:hypothetical protein
VLDHNFMSVSDEELGCNRVLLTMVGGEIVLALEAFASTLSSDQRALNAQVRARE